MREKVREEECNTTTHLQVLPTLVKLLNLVQASCQEHVFLCLHFELCMLNLVTRLAWVLN